MPGRQREAVIVAYGRSAVAKAIKGALKDTFPADFAGQVLDGVLNKIPRLPREDIEDVLVGCSGPEGRTGCNVARLIARRAGLPFSVPAQTVNRFCSSGLQAIASAANAIMAGQMETAVAGGVETMTRESTGFREEFRTPWILENAPDLFLSMGLTAENVAAKWGVTRLRMDEFSVESHRRAAAARAAGKFREEIIPVRAVNEDGGLSDFLEDQCIRPDSSVEALAGLKTSFKENGTVTAGNSSQLSDGAGMLVLMTPRRAERYGLAPIARFAGFAVGGVDPAYMGIGPIVAVPKLMKLIGLRLEDMDVIELNEAFASQAMVCISELGMDAARVNPNGGAIAMGHPMGGTGAILTCKALSELKRVGGRYGLISMCVGGGMGAAGVVEML